ncbi:hypothetical protein D3C84_748220 [compost metagenome]
MPFNPTNAKPGDGQPAPADAQIAMAPDGSGLIYIEAPQPPSLAERLATVAEEARRAGYVVAILYPEELFGVDPEALQIQLVRAAKVYVNSQLDPEQEESLP